MNRRPVEMAHTEERPPAADAGSPDSAGMDSYPSDIDNYSSGGDFSRREGTKSQDAPSGRRLKPPPLGDEEDGGQGRPPHQEEHIDPLHIDKVAQAVCRLLGVQAQPRLTRRLRDWPQLSEDSEDLCQLAAIAFLEAYRQGRIAPDEAAGEHTARSVASYAAGICSHIFANAVRRSKPLPAELAPDTGDGARATSSARATDGGGATEGSPFSELLSSGPGDDDDRLWDVLSAVKGPCREEDIILTYLLASGVTATEMRQLLNLGENKPAKAVRRVGRGLRGILGLDSGGAGAPPASAGHQSSVFSHQEDSGAGVPARLPDAPRDGRATVMDEDGRPMGRPYPDASGDARATEDQGGKP